MSGTGGRTVAWFHPFSGIAGDMALGALLDAGAELGEVESHCRRLAVPGWTLTAERVDRAGLTGVAVRVAVTEQTHHRRARHIIDLIGSAGLPERVAARAIAVFERLAAVEAALHGVPPDEVHFHEVGAVDSIVDTVGVAVALELLGIDGVACGPVAVGVGTIRAAHGVLPNPAPAVSRLLIGLPVRGVDEPRELTTPTGAAIVAALGETFGALPQLTVTAAGYGAGGRDLPGRPNLLQVIVGQEAAAPLGRAEEIVVLETTVDDVTGEVLAYTVQRCLELGALDAWLAPVTMKKGRPGAVLTVLSTPARATTLAGCVLQETGTLGLRTTTTSRLVAEREVTTVELAQGTVRTKRGPHGEKAEYDDVAELARRTGLPFRRLADDAVRRRPGPR
jgi:pyridinium-3,5-bisthiocarboxylic acid mononucleotide nickel chelatase